LQTVRLREALNLRPWHPVPCTVNLSYPEDAACPSGLLARRMDQLGISRFHCDPLRAVSSAERREAELTKNEIMATAASVIPMRPKPKRGQGRNLPPVKPVDATS
jgi:hypothetical protein